MPLRHGYSDILAVTLQWREASPGMGGRHLQLGDLCPCPRVPPELHWDAERLCALPPAGLDLPPKGRLGGLGSEGL
jgi:hypothetical protein